MANPTNPTYTLPADASIRDIDAVWHGLREALDASATTLEVNAAGVERPDTALVQLLAVAVLRAQEQGKSVRVVQPSSRLRDLVGLLAMDVVLGD